MSSDKNAIEKFLFVLSQGDLSLLELKSVISRNSGWKVSIGESAPNSIVLETNEKTAVKLIKGLGSSYKVGRVLGSDLKESLSLLDLPFNDKFNYTVSGYACSEDEYRQAHQELHLLLKRKGLGKTKYLEPQTRSEKNERIIAAEIKASEILDRVLSPELKISGIDFVIQGGFHGGKLIYAQTIEVFDVKGYDERDFKRPYQDPTRTVSPRLARLLVNLAIKEGTRSLLDPFAGLGTVLQEALLSQVSVIGVDRDQSLVDKAKANLRWLKEKYAMTKNTQANLFAYDARRLSRARMPKVDAIASEPILLPIFKFNPGPAQGREAMQKADLTYEKSFREFREILATSNNGRIVITSPRLFDSSGRSSSLDLLSIAASNGFKPYSADLHMNYPFQIVSSKKKVIQRDLFVFHAA
ncbi:MAG: TRM11 family SAM-dependent methyltransferase [Nitrososphaerales archaeon]